MPVNYQNAVIYMISSNRTKDVYIYSTTQLLDQRIQYHRRNKKCPSQAILKLGGKITLIEDFPCNNKYELNERLTEIIRATPNVINHYVAGRREPETIKKRIKEWHFKHKEQIAEKARQKYLANKAKLDEKSIQYYWANKERISQNRKQRINCECGGHYTAGHRSHHIKSKKHIRHFKLN